jgi:hypothetical protein
LPCRSWSPNYSVLVWYTGSGISRDISNNILQFI